MYPKKNPLKPWVKKAWIIPSQAITEFIYHMEDVIDLYTQSGDPKRPVVSMDEVSKQLINEVFAPLPLEPGQPARYDYHYYREGV